METLRLIIDRCESQSCEEVFIPLEDFPWFHRGNGQLTRLCSEGMSAKPFFSDNVARIRLTDRGRHFFDESPMQRMLPVSKLHSALEALSEGASIEGGLPGLGKEDTYRAVRQLQDEGFIGGVVFVEDDACGIPLVIRLGKAFVTMKGREFLSSYMSSPGVNVSDGDLINVLVSACAKIADNPSSYSMFDEDGLNRELRDFLDLALSPQGYSVSDQTQQGLGKSGNRPGELDIRIGKCGVPVAILEGLIHRSERYLREHIEKATGRYNLSGCKAVLIIEFPRNKDFNRFWESSCNCLANMQGVELNPVDTGLFGVKMLRGTFDWNEENGDLLYIGVNCC